MNLSKELIAYINGFITGDIALYKDKKGKLIAQVSTTQPSFEKLFVSLFKIINAKIYKWAEYKRRAYGSKYQWVLRAIIPDYTEKLICKYYDLPLEYSKRLNLLEAFTAGLIAADGSITIERHRKNFCRPCVKIVNKNNRLLQSLVNSWRRYNVFFSGPLLHCKSTSTWHIRLRGSEAYIFIVNHLIKFPLNPIHEKKVKIISK